MKINEKLIEKLFNHKLFLKKEEDKIAISEYEDFIPMFDIYTFKIYPIKKEDLFFYLNEKSFRFIDEFLKDEIDKIFANYLIKFDSTKDKDQKVQLSHLIRKFMKMKKLIENYIVEILINTSYKTLFNNSNIDESILYNLSISICKRNSFHPYINYLKPYYTKLELIKLGQNMEIIDKKAKVEKLLDKQIEREVCMLARINDIDFQEIKNHSITILKNFKITDVTFYSYIGASLLNRFLRLDYKINTLNKFYYNRLKNIVSIMKKTPGLKKDYQIYRFISDDKFLKNKKIGEVFMDNGFLSTTRDPFYSSGVNGTFGLILVKVHLKKNIKGNGLFIEHFSLFPKEEEFLLPPFTKLKLISKNSNFKYYHINEEFENKINKKYELEFAGLDYNWIKKIKVKEEPINELNLNEINVSMNIFNSLINKFNQIKINNLIFNYYIFDGNSSYRKFYYNKIENGVLLLYFDKNGYPAISIELGNELIVNHLNQFYFYNEKESMEKETIEIVKLLAKMFNYSKIKIFHNFENFSKFKSNYIDIQEVFLYMNHYNETIYDYLKHKKKPTNYNKDNYKKIDLIMNKSISNEYKILFKYKELTELKTNKEVFIKIVEKHFDEYTNFCNHLKIDSLNYDELYISDKKNNKNLELKDKEYKNGDIYNLIYRPIFDRLS